MSEWRANAQFWAPVAAAAAAVLAGLELLVPPSGPATIITAFVLALLVWIISRLLAARTELEGHLQLARIAANSIDQNIWIEEYPSGETIFVTSTYEKVWGHGALTLMQAAESRLEAVHPADRQRVRREIRTGQAEGELFRHRFRMTSPPARSA